MKRNVDLTEDRVFSRHNGIDTSTHIAQFIRDMIRGKYPWSVDSRIPLQSRDEDDFDYQRTSLVALGNKTKRAEIVEYRQMESGKYCECCGALISKFPWEYRHFAMGLCAGCEKSVYSKRVKPWVFPEPRSSEENAIF
jgi:hypothetical protein